MASPNKPWNKPKGERGSASRPFASDKKSAKPEQPEPAKFNAVPEFQRGRAGAGRPGTLAEPSRPSPTKPQHPQPPKIPPPAQPAYEMSPAMRAALGWFVAVPVSARCLLLAAAGLAVQFSQAVGPARQQMLKWVSVVTITSHLSILRTLLLMLRSSAGPNRVFHAMSALGCAIVAFVSGRGARRDLKAAVDAKPPRQVRQVLMDHWQMWLARFADPACQSLQAVLHAVMLLKAAGVSTSKLTSLSQPVQAVAGIVNLSVAAVAATCLAAAAQQAHRQKATDTLTAIGGVSVVWAAFVMATLQALRNPGKTIALASHSASLGAATLLGATPLLLDAPHCAVARGVMAATLCNGWSAFIMSMLQHREQSI